MWCCKHRREDPVVEADVAGPLLEGRSEQHVDPTALNHAGNDCWRTVAAAAAAASTTHCWCQNQPGYLEVEQELKLRCSCPAGTQSIADAEARLGYSTQVCLTD